MKSGAAFFGMVGVGAVAFALGFQTGRTGNTSQPQAQAQQKPAANNAQPARPTTPPDQTVYKVPVRDAYCKGPADAKVTVIEFSEFQCPFCNRVLPTMKQVQQTYGNDVRVCFKHNPLPFHQDAPLASVASLAAGEQGKFWEMHDKLFENQKALKRPDLEKYAQELGLDMNKFKAALDNNPYKARIDADVAEAAQFGARGTPSFFINGKSLRGAQPFDAFKTAIDGALKDADAALAAGASRADLYAKLTEKGLTKAAEQPQQRDQPAASRQKVELTKTEICKGPTDAKITIVEYSEFQCPFCARVGPTVKQIMQTWPKDVKFCFRHNPLPFHKDAPLASEAALAAADQGKFWEMHDKLFENQKGLQRADLEKYAQELGLDMNKFKASLDNNAHKAQIDADMASAAKFGARGTPAFFINGTPLSGAQPFDNFKAAIEKEIALADDLMKKGTPLAKLYEEVLKQAPSAPAAQAQRPGADPNKVYNVTVGQSYAKGPATAPITIVEFSDFQCPFCSRVGPTLKQIEDTYKGKVRIAFKHNPLPFHQDAPLASKAALAAGEQGKFWEMHDKLFANQKALKRENLVSYAKEIGLDMGKFEKDLDNPKYDEVIKKDMAEGAANGASGTPTFFINGRQLVGAQPFDAFKNLIEEELKKKS
ncbi:MAG: thioredoxin domain-containing protein [Myxococcota bacterium]